MKSEIIKSKRVTPVITWENVKYPCLIERPDGNGSSYIVIAFNKSEGYGINIEGKPYHKLSIGSRTWEESNYKICTNPITIKFSN